VERLQVTTGLIAPYSFTLIFPFVFPSGLYRPIAHTFSEKPAEERGSSVTFLALVT
jgi:hypothetical protein